MVDLQARPDPLKRTFGKVIYRWDRDPVPEWMPGWRPNHFVWPVPWRPSNCFIFSHNSTDGPPVLPMVLGIPRDSVDPQQQSLLFSRLSPEIRDRIYQYALETHCDPDEPYRERGARPRCDWTGGMRICTALLRTCRRAYTETWAMPVLHTTVMIQDAQRMEADNPPRSGHEVPGRWCFYLRAWQVMLIRSLDVYLTQEMYERNIIPDWIGRLNEAKSRCRKMVLDAVTEENREFVENSLLNVQLQTLTFRANRLGWILSKNEPAKSAGGAEDSGFHTTSYDLEPPEKALRLVCPDPAPWHHPNAIHDGSFPFYSKNFEFRLILQTQGSRPSQIDRLVEQVKNWSLKAPPLAPQSPDDATEYGAGLMVWDGRVRAENWVLPIPESYQNRGLLKTEPHPFRVEERTVRFVAKERNVSG
ncbi:hypothetical protein S7711_10522 [Stachybotrys chartarum IBT 7711]|uniref:Uncharacterized protein n=1 Tax=Stachybotrys chartarum (strain CBS 109288 / IBT 7711) TaxID=1280523 RepID=A0A084AJ81_STACB|nr:hypothetical protein S7711_10522 [Stachybotrys chartarum IBT 7711]